MLQQALSRAKVEATLFRSNMELEHHFEHHNLDGYNCFYFSRIFEVERIKNHRQYCHEDFEELYPAPQT